MKSKLKYIFMVVGAMVCASTQADTLFTNTVVASSILDGNNWTNGTPTGGSNLGFIKDGLVAGWPADVSGYDIVITNATLRRSTGGNVGIVGDSDLIIQNGGIVHYNPAGVTKRTARQKGTSSITIESGGQLLAANKNFEMFNTAQWFVNGGAVATSGGLTFGAVTPGTPSVVFGAGSGTVTLGSAGLLGLATDKYVNFLTGSDGTLNISGKDATYYEGLWDAGNLRVDGANAGDFSENFTVVGSALTLGGMVLNKFENGSGDGTWTNAANWTTGTPSAALAALVNGNRTANLSGTAGTAKSLQVGTVSGESGAVINGALTVLEATLIGAEDSATGTVEAATFTLSSAADLTVGSGLNAKGVLVGGNSTTIDSGLLVLAAGSNAVGTINIGTGGSVTNSAGVQMATGQDSLATFEASSLTLTGGADLEVATGEDSTANFNLANQIVLASTNGLFVGTGTGSSHNLAAADFSVTGPIGNIEIGPGSGAEIASLVNANDSLGSLRFDAPFTVSGGTHEINGITVNDALTVSGGTPSIVSNSPVTIASTQGASASLNLTDFGSGDMYVGAISVARGGQTVGSLSYADGNLILGAGMEVCSGNSGGAEGTLLAKSLLGGQQISVCQNGGAATGTVTVLENVVAGTVRIGRGVNMKATFTVGGALEVTGPFLNVAGGGANSTASITADSLLRTNGTVSIEVAGGANTDGRITANSGSVRAGGLSVATASGAKGHFAITNGTLTLSGAMYLATSENSEATVLVAIHSSVAKIVNIGTGSNAVGTLTLTGGTLLASDLTLGSINAGVGTIELAGNLVVTGAMNIASGSYINASGDAMITWAGKTSTDFEALWDAGKLKSGGVTGPGGFSNYFSVTGDTLTHIDGIGDMVISGPVPFGGGEGMILSWPSLGDKTYRVESRDNLIVDAWVPYTNSVGVYSSLSGVGGFVTVTTLVEEVSQFYRPVQE